MMSMGQSIEVTPLQMLTAVSAIANAGARVTPRIVRSITSETGGPEPIAADPSTRILSAQTARTIARMMESVVDEGTGRSAAIPGYRVAGKTGTAQKVVNGVYSHTAHVASFVGFAPATGPALAAIVVLDEPVGSYYGGDVAAPTWARVVGAALSYLRVPPTEPILPRRVSPAAVRARAESPARRRNRVDRTSLDADGRLKAADGPFPAPWPSHQEAAAGTMPGLFGWNLRDALVSLVRAGCRPRITGSGFVVEQTPAAGAPLGPDPACHVTLAPELPPSDREANLGS
jgi:membrane peptidoglycan carboxypeptidase